MNVWPWTLCAAGALSIASCASPIDRAAAASARQDWDAAVVSLEEALQSSSDPKQIDSIQQKLADAREKAAQVHLATADRAKALGDRRLLIESVKRAYELNPSDITSNRLKTVQDEARPACLDDASHSLKESRLAEARDFLGLAEALGSDRSTQDLRARIDAASAAREMPGIIVEVGVAALDAYSISPSSTSSNLELGPSDTKATPFIELRSVRRRAWEDDAPSASWSDFTNLAHWDYEARLGLTGLGGSNDVASLAGRGNSYLEFVPSTPIFTNDDSNRDRIRGYRAAVNLEFIGGLTTTRQQEEINGYVGAGFSAAASVPILGDSAIKDTASESDGSSTTTATGNRPIASARRAMFVIGAYPISLVSVPKFVNDDSREIETSHGVAHFDFAYLPIIRADVHFPVLDRSYVSLSVRYATNWEHKDRVTPWSVTLGISVPIGTIFKAIGDAIK